MTAYVFEQLYPVDRQRLFALHESPAVLPRLQDPREFRLLSHPGHIRAGARVAVQNRVGPFWLSFEFEHVLYEPPHRFGEELVRGPFRFLRHVHEFESRPEGTLIRDRLELALPWWLGGRLAERLVVGPRVRRTFRRRHEALARLLADTEHGP